MTDRPPWPRAPNARWRPSALLSLAFAAATAVAASSWRAPACAQVAPIAAPTAAALAAADEIAAPTAAAVAAADGKHDEPNLDDRRDEPNLDRDRGEPDLIRVIAVGDTLVGLANRELDWIGRWRDVAAYNNIVNPRAIPAGSQVRIRPEWLRSKRLGARFEAIGGQVRVNGAPRRVGDTAAEGDTLQTRATDTAVVSLPDGSLLRIAPDSRVRIERLRAYHSDEAIEARFRLDHGGVEPNSPTRRKRPLEVRTPAGNAAVRGTNFRVRAQPADATIEVLSGEVAANSKGGNATVGASTGAVVSPLKAPVVEALLPAPPLAGRWPLPLETTQFQLDLPPVPGAAAYRVELARDPGFVELIKSQEVAATQLQVTSDRDGPIHLRVRGVSAAGIEGYDSVALVRVAARPVPPTFAAVTGKPKTEPPAPLSGPVEVRWIAATPGLRYQVQLAADEHFEQVLEQQTVSGTAATLTLPDTARPVPRYWRVAALDREDGHRGPFSATQVLQQRAPAVIERAEPVPTWRDTWGEPIHFGTGQLVPGY